MSDTEPLRFQLISIKFLLLCACAGSGRPVTRGAGWAGPQHWRFRSAAAAAALSRLQAASGTGKPRAAGRKSAKAEFSLDFEALPQLDAGAFAAGSRKETCLATATAAKTLLPDDHHYHVRPGDLKP